MRLSLILALAAGLAASPALAGPKPQPPCAPPPGLAAALADPYRPAADREADPVRDPADTLAFSGLRPGMVVAELFPSGGYFTRLIADIVGPKGRVHMLENAGWAEAVAADRKLLAEPVGKRLDLDVEPFGRFKLGEPVDLFWITQNYHDLKIAEYGKVDTDDFNRAVFAALKPGGVYLILDHEAPAGTSVEQVAKLHRIEKAQVIREVEAAGFKLIADGGFLGHPDDDHKLPIFDKTIRGRTDQYALKFAKP